MATTTICYYNVLGIRKSATKDEIRAAYKKQALNLHPDKNPNGEDLFKQVLQAYSVLASPTKRKKYDGESLFPGEQNYPPPPSSSGSSSSAQPPPPNYAPKYRRPSNFTNERQARSQDEFQRHARNFAEQNVSFSEWFKTKQEEWQQVEHEARQKAEVLRKKMHEQMAAEEAEQRAQSEKERNERVERERVIEQQRVEAERIARENLRREREAREKAAFLRAQEVLEMQKRQAEDLDRAASELAQQRADLAREKAAWLERKRQMEGDAFLNQQAEEDRRMKEAERLRKVEEEVAEAEK
eukprot:PhF_6_TR9167/c2_g1_i2/m.14257